MQNNEYGKKIIEARNLREAIRDNANKNKSISDIVDLKNNIVQSIKAGTRSEIIKIKVPNIRG